MYQAARHSNLEVPSSELVEDRQHLRAFYAELAEFEEKKRRLAELECRLNMQVRIAWS